ncbi:isopentenyl phosphate kinase [Candidatus Methanosphaera massiliense]|jgi:isopentenyl phosphate kinase|uniref:isopentenyl phosphate kinase n=1 Tax=Methanosphaera TaxID=2316 RepID=UPI00237FFFCC|nr:isopentenyl phosphate kinase [Candidatus Methanosphaera massiliense]MDE4078514.1 isopentenyl phosphate kinase [Candidatus Methanosphaera massiliense]
MIIIKIGGSALTVKDADKPTLDEDNLERIAGELSAYNDDMIIVHGAGSYGHIYAKKYGIGDVISNVNDHLYKLEGVCRTQASVQLLNYMVCEKLQEKGIPAIGMKPSAYMTTNNKRIDMCDTGLIRKYLDNGFVPVLYGDAVLDNNDYMKYAIISGDQIITYLAEDLNADRVILSSDVDGIYTDNPKTNPDAELLEVVTRDTDLKTTENENQADVTGGMYGKIRELLDLADHGIESLIINADKPGNIRLAVSGQKVKGTLIK